MEKLGEGCSSLHPGGIKWKKESLEGGDTDLPGSVRASGPKEARRDGKSGVGQSLRSPDGWMVGSRMEQGERGSLKRAERGLGTVQNERSESLSRGWALAVGGAEWERHSGDSKRRHLFQKTGSQRCPIS